MGSTLVVLLIKLIFGTRDKEGCAPNVRVLPWYLLPYLGKVIHLTNIFQMGWFNHQLDYISSHRIDGNLVYLLSHESHENQPLM